MAAQKVTQKDLQRELGYVHDRYPKLGEDELFVLWFLRAYVTGDVEAAARALTGGSGDKSVDAVYIDEQAKIVFLAQGKYGRRIGQRAESRSDVVAFAQLAETLWGDARKLRALWQGMSPEVQERLKTVRDRLKKRRYRLKLFYVTTGTCSSDLEREADLLTRQAGGPIEFVMVQGKHILRVLADYLDGVAPPVPLLELELETGQGIQALQRFDRKTGIETWVCSMTGDAVASLYDKAGVRLFARNVRGYLGSTGINRSMRTTLDVEPDYFWYYNNGITMICDEAEKVERHGRAILRVANPQVINGQQTTRVLAGADVGSNRASVLVRVIKVPRDADDESDRFERLVSAIVAATNWQNAIRASDLMSNDRLQVDLERQLRNLGYLYLRKRQSKSEARRVFGNHYHFFITKEELARASAGCNLDPSILRRGMERLFEEPLYGEVFPNSEPDYYLLRYWVMDAVTKAARGYPERAYAKWLVLSFLWSQLRPVLRSNGRRARFRALCERKEAIQKPLMRAAGSAFTAALRFYRANRGKGARAIDVSTFFQRTDLDKQFPASWRAPSNPNRTAFERYVSRIDKRVRQD